MKIFFRPLLAFIVLIGCIDGDKNANPANASVLRAVEKAAAKCSVSTAQMNWLRDKIKESETEVSKQGSFYAIKSSVGTIVVQQPVMSSRLPSLTYSCDGSVPTLDQVIITEIVAGMTEDNKIFGL